MGLFDQIGQLFSAMGGKAELSMEDKLFLDEKSASIPELTDRIFSVWEKTDDKSKPGVDGLKAVYDALNGSGAGKTASFAELLDAIEEESDENILSRDELYDWGIELDRLSPRIPGTVAMDQTAQYLEEKLRSFGVETWTEPINFRGVFFHEWSFEIAGPERRSFICFPENNVGFGDVEAQIVDAGRGREEDYEGKDVSGKIVLVDWGELWDHEGPCALRERYGLLHLYDVAYVNGAAGMIGYFSDTPGNTLKLVEPGIKPIGGSNIWGRAETGPNHQFALPVLNIGREDGLWLKDLIGHGSVEGRMVIKGVRKVSTTQTVAGILPGKTDRIIACGAHSCTAFEGAVCDTVGTVGALALAKYFASKPVEEREKTMFFFFDSFHVWGNCCQTAISLLDRHKTLAANIDAFLWLDHIGDGRSDTARLATVSDHPVLWPLTALAMAKRGILPLALPIAHIWSVCATGAHERAGIPNLTVQAMNDDTLTPEDTWNKFDPEVLFRDIMLHVDLASALHRTEILRNEPGEPLGGCGALFTDLSQPDYPEGEHYVPEPSMPLYVGGGESPVRILKTQEEKDAFVGRCYV